MIRKNLSNITKSSESKASFVASTMTSDRYGDVVEQTWNLESFKSNPVILLNHRQDMLPIARAENVEVKDGQLEIDVIFDTGDDLGAEVARKVKAGFMSAVSVGFQPGKSISRSELPQDHKAHSANGGMYFSDNELLEVSIVTIPANGEAILTSKDYSMNNVTKQDIRQIFRSELLSLKTDELKSLTQIKHILQIEENEDTIVITYAKGDHDVQDDDEREMESESNQELDDQVEGYTDDEDSQDETERQLEDQDDDRVKTLLEYLLS